MDFIIKETGENISIEFNYNCGFDPTQYIIENNGINLEYDNIKNVYTITKESADIWIELSHRNNYIVNVVNNIKNINNEQTAKVCKLLEENIIDDNVFKLYTKNVVDYLLSINNIIDIYV